MVLECRDQDSLNNNTSSATGPHLSVSLCCIWEQPAPAVLAPPPPPPVMVRPPGRPKRCLADRASWAGFSARGRSHVLMGTQVLPHHLNAREFLPAGVATSTPLRPKSFAAPTDSEDWLDPPVGQTPHHTAFAMDVMKHGRRRSRDSSGGRQTQLRSPMVQRPSAAKVTLQGWLYKQGSEGLMLWKRRWFVLSEYCLFYYKGPEEEKLLGSILLPSYKISPCAPDDRVFRKFSFKAEHHNMRTYFFAADSREMMVRWMNAMSLASILQTAVPSWEEPASSSRPSVSSVSQSADDSDSGFHGYRSPRGNTTPRQGGDGASAKEGVETNGWGPPNMQPLYANAPPKPKRLPQGDSPEPSPERPPHPQQLTPRGGIYGVSPRSHTEGRTPDPYGRPLDYEDVYGRKGAWPPPPPQAYMNEPKLDNHKSSPHDNNNYAKPPPDVTKTYVKPVGPQRPLEPPTKQPPPATLPKQAFRMTSPAPPVKPRPKPPAGHPPRPHSADFLETDIRDVPPSVVPRREKNSRPVERPKSSIEVHNDDYWSEESYARKMRQSLYMHAQAHSGRTTPMQKHPGETKVKPPTHARPGVAQPDGRVAEEQQIVGPSRRYSEQMDRHGNQFMRSASARLPRHKSRHEQHEQTEAPGSEKKIQQREESMQRLLEWKQRMLQSPLTRKSSPRPHDNSIAHSPLSHLLLRTPDAPATPGSDAGSVTFRPRRQPTRGPNSSTSSRSRSQDPGRRSAPPIQRRNSYSSDDEDVQREARSNRRPRKSATSSQQAGRVDTVDERRRVHTPSGSAVLPFTPDYVNINAFGEKKQHRIPPDVHYSHDAYGVKKSSDTLTRYAPQQTSPSKSEQPTPIPTHLHPAIGKTTPTTASIQRLIPMEDRNGKHSDSGYDSLRVQGAGAEIKRTVPPKSSILSQPTDESQLIKEFSYQYIHSSIFEASPPKVKNSPEGGQERSPSRVKFQMQESPSNYQNIEPLSSPGSKSTIETKEEEEIASLRKSRQINLRSFALGEPGETESAQRVSKSPPKSGSSNNNKSVRDLLADFERKSAALAREQEIISAKEAKRCVFSDTETLLYDTSSDAEINYVDESKLRKNVSEMKQQRRCVSRAGERSEDDDEEIAAALGIKDGFVSSGRELHAKRKELQNRKRKQPSKKLQMEDLPAPGYTRLSLAESMVAHEDSASSRSSPSPNPPVSERIKTPEISVAAAEEHYLPMTPSKKSILEQNGPVLQLEECSYVEMGEDGVKTLNSVFERNDSAICQEMKYFEIDTSKKSEEEDSHYEFLYKATTKYEPVYMEVPPIDPLKPLSLSLPKMDSLHIEHSKTSSTSSSSRTVVYNEGASDTLRALPDILNSTSSQKDKSDSDDADDEASKDLENLDTPHHPRFSLSDTFRPASYYLGVGSRNNDPHDSSDSDLVSPPPIPSTLPPLDDEDEDFSLDLSRHSHGSQDVQKWPENNSFSSLRSAPGRSSMDGSEADRLKRRPVSEELLDSFEESSFLTDYTKYGISESAYHKDIIAQDENMYATNKPLPKDLKSDLLFREIFPPSVSQPVTSVVVEDENQNGARSRSRAETSPGKNEAAGGAPYYYSDLLKVMDEETNSMYDRYQQHAVNQLRPSSRLNNQRNDGLEGKRSDVGRHVNPIPLLNGILDLNDPNLIAEEIRNTTAGLVSKSVPVDERNIYEADTLRKMAQKRHLQRRRSKTPDPDIATRNLYPAGLRDKFESSFEARRRSRSLEGLVDVEEGLQQPLELEPTNEGADPWEEDTLWRESLRRVSIRHTRSLDDLDENESPPAPAPGPSGRRSVDHLAGAQRPAKVTRDVTYVNDVAVRPRMIRSKELYESDYREGRRSASRQNQVPPPPPPEEDSGLYERLLPTESMERNRRGQTYVDRYEFDVDNEMFRPPAAQNGSQQPHFLEESLPPSFEIDREKLRQWDLLSSAPLEDGATPAAAAAQPRVHPTEGGPVGLSNGPQSPQTNRQGGGRQPTVTTKQPITKSKVQSDQQSLGGSGSGSIQDSIPAVRSHRQQQRPSPTTVQPVAAAPTQEDMGGGGHAVFKHGAGLGSRGASPKLNPAAGLSPLPPGLYGPEDGHNTSDSELARRPFAKAGISPLNKVSAGALLGRTHEELVLLLIQLRRESSSLSRAAELCRTEILSQARLAELDAARRAEHLRRLEDLKRHLQEIEKQYEKGKPLVNLVDNMVKLGSMYRGSSINSLPRNSAITPPPMQRYDFNLHDQRLMADDRRDWNRLSPPEHAELQAKMQQFYHMERQLQEQTLILQNLQQDKTLLQRALGGLRHKLATSTGAEADRFIHQQRLLEREFSRVRHLLAMHSKKMEDIVVDNARIEHDIMMLRQKQMQASRMMERSATPTMMVQGTSAAALELELRRVQTLVGDLQRQRHDLSAQLTEKRHSLTQTPELRGKIRSSTSPNNSPASLPSTPRLRRPSSSWLETDLDSMHTEDLGINTDSPLSPLTDPRAPLYVNTEIMDYSPNGKDPITPDDLSPPPPPAPEDPSLYNGSATTYYEPQDISEADDRMKRFYGIIPKTEKAEIKTVRIVKRESERRNRVKQRPSMEMDLSRVTEEDHPPPPSELELSLLMELQAQQDQQAIDPHVFQRSLSLPRGFGKQPPPPPSRTMSPRSDNINLRASRTMSPQGERPLSAHAQLFGSTDEESPRLVDEGVFVEGSSSSGPVSPVYQSEAARAIVQEMTRRRAVPKTKRRHHTVTGGGQQQDKAEANMGSGARARDDLDMERALRRRVAGAPDVVRSTLSQRELKYNETTIDNLLGTPNKIVIPERYVPEKEPELSAEEQLQRLRKAESIRKMLSETTPHTSESQAQSPNNDGSGEEVNSTMKLKLAAEKKQREHLLQLNQILAQQVMEKSKMVAARALEITPNKETSTEEDDSSPISELPFVQHRDNFFS
ncbi:uncharacterized protein LOC132201047 isoform X3 [Neocloeon triangulifer]|uniref:uncharacterized protein LOC132201047 isoform X3 n=1 Tax=Neocloeon triangulifer TaxID=2078957 RepID=UPI00286F39C4|nr:uncharacterized protein LOC132201047 isoform X3 [Neocloeon triangulifer]